MAKSVLNAPHFQNEAAAFDHVEAMLWPNGPVCPHCRNANQAKIGRLQGKTTRLGLRKCYACKKPFTVRMGTIFEDSHLPLHLWLQIIHLMCASKKGISTRQVQRMLECSMKTAWFLTHRIREAMKANHGGIFPEPMGGAGKTVEVDETYIGRAAGTKAFLPVSEKQPVVALVERNGSVRSFHFPTIRANSLRSVMARHISLESNLMTDESRMYTYIGHNFASHWTVNHTEKQYVRYWNEVTDTLRPDGKPIVETTVIATNTVEGYFSILKRGIYGVYQHVSEAHLKRYLCEFDFRYNNRIALGVDDTTRAANALKGAKGKRLTYETTNRANA
jgi:transposase-like protein